MCHQEFVFLSLLVAMTITAGITLALHSSEASKRETKLGLFFFPSNDFSLFRIAVFLCLCVCVCVHASTHSAALSLRCFISIRTQRLG